NRLWTFQRLLPQAAGHSVGCSRPIRPCPGSASSRLAAWSVGGPVPRTGSPATRGALAASPRRSLRSAWPRHLDDGFVGVPSVVRPNHTMVKTRLDRWMFESFATSAPSLGIYRMIFASYLLLFAMPSVRWVSAVPDAFFTPP